MEELMIKPVPEMAGSYGEDKTVWAKDEESRTKPLPPSSGVAGDPFPSCLRCGPARYPDAAVKAKVQGTVILDVVIGAHGRAEKISSL
jgi:outer membrane biosynthesis protein TonB